MGTFFFIDFVISFFVLLAIHAPWWAWVIYAVGAVVWFVIWSLCDSGSSNSQKPQTETKQA